MSGCALLIRGLLKHTKKDTLFSYFNRFGALTEYKMLGEIGAEESCAVVKFATAEQAKNALKSSSHFIDGVEVNLFGESDPPEIKNQSNQKTKDPNRQELKMEESKSNGIFISGLSKEITNDALREYLTRFGDIETCFSSDSLALVTFKSHIDANTVLIGEPHYIVDNRITNLCEERKGDKEEIDRRIDSMEYMIARDECTKEINTGVKSTGPSQRDLTFYVTHLAPQTTGESLRAYFSKFGQLTRCELKVDPKVEESRRFGLVTFATLKENLLACYSGPHLLDGKYLNVRGMPKDMPYKSYGKTFFGIFMISDHS